jgi:hypothetical protein
MSRFQGTFQREGERLRQQAFDEAQRLHAANTASAHSSSNRDMYERMRRAAETAAAETARTNARVEEEDRANQSRWDEHVLRLERERIAREAEPQLRSETVERSRREAEQARTAKAAERAAQAEAERQAGLRAEAAERARAEAEARRTREEAERVQEAARAARQAEAQRVANERATAQQQRAAPLQAEYQRLMNMSDSQIRNMFGNSPRRIVILQKIVKFHPDKGGLDSMFAGLTSRINRAYREEIFGGELC